MSMSYKLKMFDVDRDSEISITQQLVTRIAALIDAGELAPGARLPATRALAADAGINHLTAVRVYRRRAVRPVSYADEMLRDSLHAPLSGDAIALGSGYPDPELCPSEELGALAADIVRENPRAITGYLQVEGQPELRERLAELGREAGYATSADEILVTTGARQALDLVARAILGPGDVAVVESPTFAGALASLQA